MTRQRKTRNEWIVQGYYGHGWEDVNAEETWPDARRSIQEYRDNEPTYPHRVIRRRVRITEEAHA